MSVIARLGLSVLFGCAPLLGHTDELPHFQGQTVADAVVKRQALMTISVVINAKFRCTAIDEVTIQALSLSEAQLHIPVAAHLPLKGTEPATYERWTISACSKSQSFIMTFWIKDGSMRFMTMTEKVSDS